MKCPECKKEIEKVCVVSKCWQYGYLDNNEIYQYDNIEEVNETLAIECPECGKNIKSHVKETK